VLGVYSTTLFAECKIIAPGIELDSPVGTAEVRFVVIDSGMPDLELQTLFTITPNANGKWSITGEQFDTIRQLDEGDRRATRLKLSDDEGYMVALPGEDRNFCESTQVGSNEGALDSNINTETCRNTASRWWGDRLNEEGLTEEKADIVAIAFDTSGNRCFVSPGYPTVGDRIVVTAVAPRNARVAGTASEVGYDPCSIQSSAPSIYIGEAAAAFDPFVPQAEAQTVHVLAERRCFDPTVVVTWQQNGEVKGRYTVSQYQRYHATLQLGVQFSDLHDSTFGLRDEAGETIIFDKGPVESGPEYVASLVLYSLPRYFDSGFFGGGEGYRGRDILHDNAFTDRLGLVLSVGLDDFGDRFAAGLSFELIRGINVTWAYEFVKVNELAGLSIGDPFPGIESDIPTREKWEGESVVGISIDLRYVTALFSRE
jgi:hypothetical protein